MVDGRDDVEFELAVAGRLEDSVVDLDFLDAGAVQFLERCDCACFLARAGGAVYQEVWKVAALGLGVLDEVGEGHDRLITRDLNRAERSWWYESVSRDRGRSLSTRRAILVAIAGNG